VISAESHSLRHGRSIFRTNINARVNPSHYLLNKRRDTEETFLTVKGWRITKKELMKMTTRIAISAIIARGTITRKRNARSESKIINPAWTNKDSNIGQGDTSQMRYLKERFH
jgi:hypothetical protein